jgi:hypothetical protein
MLKRSEKNAEMHRGSPSETHGFSHVSIRSRVTSGLVRGFALVMDGFVRNPFGVSPEKKIEKRTNA